MLVLARKRNESIVIDGGRITVTVVEIVGSHKVRLGIQAPPDVVVDREEIHDLKERGYRP